MSNNSLSSSNPDLSLHPHATGLAATFAKSHVNASDTDSPFTLYGSWFCPFVQRVWIILHLKSIPHRYVEINPYHKAAEFLARNPRGLVPTLAVNDLKMAGSEANSLSDDAGNEKVNGNGSSSPPTTDNSSPKEKILYESSIIAQYLNTVYPTRHPLTSTNPYTAAKQSIAIDFISTRIIPAFYRFLQHTPSKPYTLDSCRGEFCGHLLEFARQLHPQGPFYGGREISMVDVALIPWALRVFLIDHYKLPGGSGMGRFTLPVDDNKGFGDEDAQRALWRRYQTWFDAVEAHESVKATMSDRERYIEAYERYAEDTTGSGVGKATREGRGLP
jgi:glutathione S-transferase